MIKGIVSSLLTSSDYYTHCKSPSTEVFSRPSLDINKNIFVRSSYYATGDFGDTIAARIDPNVVDGDTILMFFSGYKDQPLPQDFKTILNTKDSSGTIHLKFGYKVWRSTENLRSYVRLHDEAFVCLLTLKGTRVILDSRGRINKGCSIGKEICTPRVETHKDGCTISCFAYSEPSPMAIKDQLTLASMECCGRGLAVGIAPTCGGLSKRMKVISESMCGGGDDIAFCVSLY